MKYINFVYPVFFGIFLSVVGHSYYFFDVDLARWSYLVISIVMLSVSLLVSKTDNSTSLKLLILTGLSCSFGYALLYTYFHIYKEFYGLSPLHETLALVFVLLAFLVFIFHENASTRKMFAQNKVINIRYFLLIFLGVTAVSITFKLIFGLTVVDSFWFALLRRTANTFWVIWSYSFMPVLTGWMILFFVFRSVMNKLELR